MSGMFIVPVSGLKEGHYNFDFEIGNSFFDLFEESEIKEGNLNADVEIDKRSSLIEMKIMISGVVRISCDRCLEMFDYRLTCENKLLVKFGTIKDYSDPEIITVSSEEHQLDLSQFFYEYIHLALPIKRIHPDDENDNSTCNPEMLLKLKEHLVEEEGRSDPRWDELKKLMNNN